MRLAELADRSGLPTATIKYYLRSGLLHPGAARSTTWSDYDETHLRRLRLVRALTDVAGLTLQEVADVVRALDDARSDHGARGAVHWPLSRDASAEPTAVSSERVTELLERHGWEVHADSPHRRVLAAALDTLDRLDLAATDELLDSYVRAIGPVAEIEVARVAAESDPAIAAERIVIGTLLYEPVLTAVRRLAHEAVSARPTRT